MEEKINIAELLRDCPKGMELDCTIFDTKVIYQGLNKRIPTHPIVIQTKHGLEFELTQYGQIHNIVGSKCVIFPPGKITWDGFIPPCKFKNGDIVFTKLGNIAIISNKRNNELYNSYCMLLECGTFVMNETTVYPERLATEEEKQTLFDAIKANGYNWNEETKTLKQLIKPKFKVGDRVKSIFNKNQYKITELTDTYYTLVEVNNKFLYTLPIWEVNNWELVSDKFNFSTLIPFESKILVRDTDKSKWVPSFWGCLVDDCKFETTRGLYYQCIPYKGNEHLMGKKEKCDDFYKIWE